MTYEVYSDHLAVLEQPLHKLCTAFFGRRNNGGVNRLDSVCARALKLYLEENKIDLLRDPAERVLAAVEESFEIEEHAKKLILSCDLELQLC